MYTFVLQHKKNVFVCRETWNYLDGKCKSNYLIDSTVSKF